MRRSLLTLGLAVAGAFVSAQAQTASAGSAGGIEFTAAQAAEGKIAYDRACRQCHGRGCGASHQTGWTGLIANLIDQLVEKEKAQADGTTSPDQVVLSRQPVHA